MNKVDEAAVDWLTLSTRQ